MYVIKGSFTGTAPAGFTLATDTIIPAEKCVWIDPSWDDTAKAYSLTTASYIDNANAAFTIVNAELGYISKTGRFVNIAK